MYSSRSFTEFEQHYYNKLEEAVTEDQVERVGSVHHSDGSPVSDAKLDAILRGRPGFEESQAKGRGHRLPRRQVRLSEKTDAALDAYVRKHGTTANSVIRDAVEAYLGTA